MDMKKVSLVEIWDEEASQIEAWAMFCAVLLGDISNLPTTYKMKTLIENTPRVSARLRAQDPIYPAFPSNLLRFIKK